MQQATAKAAATPLTDECLPRRSSFRRMARPVVVASVIALIGLASCKDQNHYAPPPPSKVGVAPPVQQKITRYLEATGNASAFNSVDLVARVQGFLDSISYTDGAFVKKGDILFTIEPPPYLAKLQEAEAAVVGDKAQVVNAQIELDRQQVLRRQQVNSQRDVDDAVAKQETAQANLDQAVANQQVAAINYTYTRVLAPFDGKVSHHLQSVGELVGTEPTKLATIVEITPIYVYFNISEQDVQRIRDDLARRGLRGGDIDKVPVEVGLQTETGYPHAGHLDYAAPTVDQSTGTLQVRGLLENTDLTLLPGNFVRVRVPVQRDVEAVLVPDTAIGADQGGRYVLVVNADNVVEQRHVTAGPVYGALRVIEAGLKPDERVIVAGVQRVVPGEKVEPQPRTVEATQ